jgi:hypothetical protein
LVFNGTSIRHRQGQGRYGSGSAMASSWVRCFSTIRPCRLTSPQERIRFRGLGRGGGQWRVHRQECWDRFRFLQSQCAADANFSADRASEDERGSPRRLILLNHTNGVTLNGTFGSGSYRRIHWRRLSRLRRCRMLGRFS